jgi:hypothetical protein
MEHIKIQKPPTKKHIRQKLLSMMSDNIFNYIQESKIKDFIQSQFPNAAEILIQQVFQDLKEDNLMDKVGFNLTSKGRETLTSQRSQAPTNFKVFPEDCNCPTKVFIAPMGTGPFVHNNLTSLIEQLREVGGQRKVIAIDMEAIAIFKVKGITCPRIVIKSVSDFGNEEKDDSFHRYASHTSAAFLLHTIINYFCKQ